MEGMLERVLPVMVSYTVPYQNMETKSDGWDCMKIALRSFHNHLPGKKVLVVDNDRDGEIYSAKRHWLNAYDDAIVVRNPLTLESEFWNNHHPRHNQHHGNGMDFGVDYCKENGYDYMLHFEPDCLVRGIAWLKAMLECIEIGAWATGLFACNHSDQIIHVCPSIWDVNSPACKPSFARQPMKEDRQHVKFEELTHFKGIARRWDRWDTGQKNWWIAELEGKAMWAKPKQNDFTHYWSGSGYDGMRKVRERDDFELAKKYLD